MYNKIKNPISGRFVNTNSKLGISIIENYINQLGGNVCGVNPKTDRCGKKFPENNPELCEVGEKGKCRKKKNADLIQKAMNRGPAPKPIKPLDLRLLEEEETLNYGLDDEEYLLKNRFGLIIGTGDDNMNKINLKDLSAIIKNYRLDKPDSASPSGTYHRYETFLDDIWELVEKTRNNYQVSLEKCEYFKYRPNPKIKDDINSYITKDTCDKIERICKLVEDYSSKQDLKKLNDKQLVKLACVLISGLTSYSIWIRWPEEGETYEDDARQIELGLEPYLTYFEGKYFTLDTVIKALQQENVIEDVLEKILFYKEYLDLSEIDDVNIRQRLIDFETDLDIYLDETPNKFIKEKTVGEVNLKYLVYMASILNISVSISGGRLTIKRHYI